jgi:hypothetical protein
VRVILGDVVRSDAEGRRVVLHRLTTACAMDPRCAPRAVCRTALLTLHFQCVSYLLISQRFSSEKTTFEGAPKSLKRLKKYTLFP